VSHYRHVLYRAMERERERGRERERERERDRERERETETIIILPRAFTSRITKRITNSNYDVKYQEQNVNLPSFPPSLESSHILSLSLSLLILLLASSLLIL